nr:zinc finger, BED-type, phospholipase-like, homeodomain-like protein [Tanacetum cinerariifolium]
MVDANLGVLKARMEEVTKKEKLKYRTPNRMKNSGWSYNSISADYKTQNTNGYAAMITGTVEVVCLVATTGVGSTSAPTVVEVLPCSRNLAIWQHFNLVKMSDNTTKAQCKFCFHFLSSSSNSRLKAHINKYCDALKTDPKVGQSSMGRDGSIFVYNPDVVHE